MDAYLKDQFDFTGVKAALLVEQSILVILRDNKPDIPWPNTWELPGGGREGQETPLECLGGAGLDFDRGIDYLVENLS